LQNYATALQQCEHDADINSIFWPTNIWKIDVPALQERTLVCKLPQVLTVVSLPIRRICMAPGTNYFRASAGQQEGVHEQFKTS